MRSSWARDAVWASFGGALAQLSGHQARAAGHVAIQRGNDALLIFAGQWKGESGLTGRPQQYETTSGYANTLFVDDNGEYLYKDARYLGGQGPFADTHAVPVLAGRGSRPGPSSTSPRRYERQRGSEDAGQRSVRLFVRNFVYLQTEPLRAVSTACACSSRVTSRSCGSTSAARTRRRSVATWRPASIGSSALHVRALGPRPVTISAAWNTVGGENLNARLAIAASAPGTELDALTVITADDKGTPAPDAAVVSRRP